MKTRWSAFVVLAGLAVPSLRAQWPSVLPMSPSSGSGTSYFFQFAYSDPQGYADIYYAEMLINTSLQAANGCYFYYHRASNVMYLSADNGSGWVGSAPLGGAGTLENSQCRLNLSTSSASGSGNNLNVTLALTFKSGFIGTKNWYSTVEDVSGHWAGWSTIGTWTVPDPNQVPAVLSMSPSSGSGTSYFFQFAYSDPQGYADIYYAEMLINTSFQAAWGCYFYYHRASNVIYLSADNGSGWVGSAPLGGGGTLENSQCKLNLSTSTASSSGNNLNITLALTFKPAFVGTKNWYATVEDNGGLWAGWSTIGSWTVPDPNQAPAVLSMSPSSGSGSSQTFQFGYSDPQGYANIYYTEMLINTSFQAAWGCYFYYHRGSNVIYLSADNGSGWVGSAALGSGGTLENSQCSLSLPSSSAVGSGNTLTVYLALTFKPAFAGTKNWYATVEDNGGLWAGWSAIGTWTVTASPPSITTNSPLPNGTVGVAYSQTLSATGGTPPYTWSVISGSLAPGLSLSSGGVLSGTPTTANTYNFTVQVAGGGTATKAFSQTIGAGLTITTSSPLPNGTVGVAYSQTLSATGGTPPYTWSPVSGFPYWLTLSTTGVLNGTPATYNAYSLNVQVTDSASQTVSKPLSLSIPSGPGVSPATTEINLAGVPIDLYNSPNNGKIASLACSASSTVKECIARFFRDDPDNFVKQGVTGVRFFFPLGAANDSTPFHNDGSIDTDWVAKLQAFFSDLQSYGIRRITPTPLLLDNWSGTLDPGTSCDGCIRPTTYASTGTCGGGESLKSYPWVPFGFRASDWAIDRKGWNDAYNCADANPNFWGWTPFIDLMDQVIQAAQNAGLAIADLDLQNEIDLMETTVAARLIYDNKHPAVNGTDVLSAIRQRMANRNDPVNFDPYRVTFSTKMSRTTWRNPLWDCASIYDPDSARLIGESELIAAYAGWYFGKPSFINWQDTGGNYHPLPCGGQMSGDESIGTMIYLPVSYIQPSATNIHAHHCVENDPPVMGGPGGCRSEHDNTTDTARLFYNDVSSFLQSRGLSGNYLVFGEANPLNNPTPPPGQECGNLSREMAFQAVEGFRASSLKGRPNTTLRVWWLAGDQSGCTIFPNAWNPPYNPNQP